MPKGEGRMVCPRPTPAVLVAVEKGEMSGSFNEQMCLEGDLNFSESMEPKVEEFDPLSNLEHQIMDVLEKV